MEGMVSYILCKWSPPFESIFSLNEGQKCWTAGGKISAGMGTVGVYMQNNVDAG